MSTSKELLRAVCEQQGIDPDDAVVTDTFEKTDRLIVSFWNALIDHASYAESAAERDAKQCMKCIEYYLEHDINNFEEIRTQINSSSYSHTFRLIQVCKQMYINQLIVIDRMLMDCPKNEAFDYIRTSFICGCNEFLAAKVVATHSKIAEIAAGVMDYRKKEVDEAIALFKQMEIEVKTKREEAGQTIAASDMVGIVHNTWKDTQSKEFYADCKVYAKMKEYLENEYARSIDYCKDVAGIVLQYCKEAIDRSLEAGTPVFDELKSWSENTISITVDSFDKINKKVIEQLSAQSMGNCHLNDQMNFSLTRMNYSKQELKFGLLRKQRVELDQYRIEERRQANDRYLSRFAEHEDRTIEKRYFNNENGLITSMIDRDLSECRLQPIGKGAQGTVYSLHLDGLKVVAKRFRSEKDRKEIANLCRVSNHPNILKMICRGYRGDEWFLVVEYCPLSLADELRRRRSSDSRALSKEEFAKWISQLAKGMKYLHGHIVELGADIYHGDLKPENILIAGDGTFKIADFGASQLMDYSAWFDEKKSMSGTPRYMAPELHRREIDIKNLKKADVWSWAVVVWEMMVNHSPYSGMDQRLLPVLIGRDSIHPPIPSGTIESLENLLRRCWNPTPVLRPSFRGIVRDVDDVIAEINAMNEMQWIEITSEWGAINNYSEKQASSSTDQCIQTDSPE